MAVDSTFASVEVNVQPNYAIGVFKDDQFVITPLKKFHQVRPSFDHVDEERQRMTIHTKEQIQAEKAAQSKLSLITNKDFGERIVDQTWHELNVYTADSFESEQAFERLSKFVEPVESEDQTYLSKFEANQEA